MRLVQVLVPTGKREKVVDTLDGEGIDYALWEETGRGNFEALVSFPIPDSGVEPVLDELYAAGIEEDAYTIVMPTETVVSERIATLQERFAGFGLRISRDELVASTEDLAPASSTFYTFLVVSTIIATAGLLLDSAATIIGAMVIAPLMGPAISASVGTVLYDREMAIRGVKLQVIGLLAAIVTAMLFAVFLRESVLFPPVDDITSIGQVAERTTPNFLSLFLALGSGVAGAVSIIRGAGSTLVGVAIAVALIPPAATVGLGVAWAQPLVAVGAAVLVLVNLLAINLSALILLWLAGYRPKEEAVAGEARSAVRRRIVVVVTGIGVLSVVLALVTFGSFQVATFEQTTNQQLERILGGPDQPDEYGSLEYESAEVEYDGVDVLFGRPAEVTVVVSRPAGDPVPPDLAQRIDDRLTEATGTPVEVEVAIVERQNSD